MVALEKLENMYLQRLFGSADFLWNLQIEMRESVWGSTVLVLIETDREDLEQKQIILIFKLVILKFYMTNKVKMSLLANGYINQVLKIKFSFKLFTWRVRWIRKKLLMLQKNFITLQKRRRISKWIWKKNSKKLV